MLQGITSTNLARVILYYLSLVALNFRNNTEFYRPNPWSALPAFLRLMWYIRSVCHYQHRSVSVPNTNSLLGVLKDYMS